MSVHLRVSVGGEHYALPVAAVREIAELGEVTAVPAAGPHVAGVRHHHGDLLPVVRLEGVLGTPPGAPRRIVIVEHDGDRIGLAVDAAEDVSELPSADQAAGPLTSGAVLHDGTLLGVVDVPALLGVVAASVG